MGRHALPAYSATKFDVHGLTVDIEFSRYGVRAVCLMPWFVETAILDAPTAGTNGVLRDDARNIYPVEDAVKAAWNAAHTDDLYVLFGKEAKGIRFAARFMPNALRKRMMRAQNEALSKR